MADAEAFLGALSDEGRAFYLDVQHKLDIAYPALIGLALILGLQMVMRRPWGAVFGVVALMATAADYFENYLVAGLLQTPVAALDPATVQVASVLTMAKSLCHTICFVTLLIGAIWKLLRRTLR